jgi:hypothetical protein
LYSIPKDSDLSGSRHQLALESGKHRFVSELQEIPAGNEFSAVYEKKVQEILEYLFEEELTDFTSQFSTRTGTGKYDITATISGDHIFWTQLLHDFKSRFIIFDCKNYSHSIKPVVIRDVHKYIHKTARRNAAIIVTRLPPAPTVDKVIDGILRDDTVLFCITDADLIEMIDAKYRGESPSYLLKKKLDNLLLKLEK